MTTTTNIEAIVLNHTPYRENDLLVSIYSLDYGKITVLARGAKKLTSKNASYIQPMTLCSIDALIKKGISTLIRANSIDYYLNIRNDLESEIIGNVIIEYYYRYVEENKPLLKDYTFLKESLNALNEGYPPLKIYLLLLTHIIHNEGIDIEVDHCLYCDSTKVCSITLSGGFVCENHRGNLPLYDKETLKAFRHFIKLTINDLDRLDFKQETLLELIPLYEYYIEEYGGIRFKSQTFINNLYKKR